MFVVVYWFFVSDEILLYICYWLSVMVVGVVMLFYGMVEYVGCYECFVVVLNVVGYYFYVIDQCGYGWIVEVDELGYFVDQGGWGKVVGDLVSLNYYICQQYLELLIFLLGYSMGSYIFMVYLLYYSCSL